MLAPFAPFAPSLPLELRPITAHDQDFLDTLYASSRDDLLALDVAPAVLASLISMQQYAQQTGIQHNYPNAQHHLVQLHHQPVGRWVIDWQGVDAAMQSGHTVVRVVRVVDICIAPSHRRRGIARWLLQALQEQARQRQASISLAVSQSNTAAQLLYQSLGFLVVNQDIVQQQRVWQS